jgi:N-acetyl-anhydromuramyl-L-alanine amidase AmpD
LWTDRGGLKAKEQNYKQVNGKRDIDLFVTHWDVCLSSRICQKVLDRRGISVHFLIDNDGTIYQTMDTTHIAWHAGSVNSRSVGVEIANAYYPKWQSWYEDKGFGKREILTDSIVNGKKLTTHLDFYPIQKEALKALAVAVNKGLGVPLKAPENITGSQYTDTLSKPNLKQFKGFIHHYHQTSKKIDCGGLDLVELLKEI